MTSGLRLSTNQIPTFNRLLMPMRRGLAQNLLMCRFGRQSTLASWPFVCFLPYTPSHSLRACIACNFITFSPCLLHFLLFSLPCCPATWPLCICSFPPPCIYRLYFHGTLAQMDREERNQPSVVSFLSHAPLRGTLLHPGSARRGQGVSASSPALNSSLFRVTRLCPFSPYLRLDPPEALLIFAPPHGMAVASR